MTADLISATGRTIAVAADEKPPPKALAMILCDQVMRDEETKKSALIGCFNEIIAPSYPALHHNFAVYVALTEGHGQYVGALRFSLQETDEELMQAEGRFRLDDPLTVMELVIRIRAVSLPKPGKYRMDFHCNGEFIIGRSIVAKEQAPEDTA